MDSVIEIGVFEDCTEEIYKHDRFSVDLNNSISIYSDGKKLSEIKLSREDKWESYSRRSTWFQYSYTLTEGQLYKDAWDKIKFESIGDGKMKVTASLYSDRSRRFVAVNIAIATVKKFGKRSTITYGEDEIEITFDGETQTYKTQHGEEASNNKTAAIGCAIMAIIIVVIALIVTIGGNSCSSKSSYSKSDAEFLDSISTPGTSEYKWYHDEYLPNTPGTPEYERNRNK